MAVSVPGVLRDWLAREDPDRRRRYLIAYSGGMDSHVLLHAMASVRDEKPFELVALHVDHAWHVESASWAEHCRSVCAELDVACFTHRLDDAVETGRGREGDARLARYRWFAQMTEHQNVLLTAHHRGDQAETVLFNLFRGAGPLGLAAMPLKRPFSRGLIVRPLLELPRDALAEYAKSCSLTFIDDPGNFDIGFDRNYLRHRILPAVAKRWPAAEKALARASVNLSESQAILDRFAGDQMDQCSLHEVPNPLSGAPVLDCALLAALPGDEFLNLARRWIFVSGHRPPSRRKLVEIHEQLVQDVEAESGCIAFEGVEVRRYRRRLYLVPRLTDFDPSPRDWRIDRDFDISGTSVRMRAREVRGEGVKWSVIAGRNLTVHFDNRAGAMVKVPNGPRRSLKNLFQEAGIPPFLRRVLPRVCLGNELIAVPLVGESAKYRGSDQEIGVRFELLRSGASGDVGWDSLE